MIEWSAYLRSIMTWLLMILGKYHLQIEASLMFHCRKTKLKKYVKALGL
jgi:hypothetical protein